MKLFQLVTREIRYQKLNFLLGLLSVAAATGVLVLSDDGPGDGPEY